MGVESVPVEEALSHADALEVSCHSPNRVLLPALEFMKCKGHRLASYRAIQRTLTCGLLETGQCHPNSERSTVLLCCQLPIDFQNISIV